MVRNPNDLGGVRTVVVDRPLDEAELVERARRGDLEAWETIVRTYQGIAFRTAYLLAGNAADAEEAAQDGFVKAHRALGRFRRGAALKPWLLRIVANEARNRRRSAGGAGGGAPTAPSLGGPPGAARPARGRREPPGGRGPVPRGGPARARGPAAAARGGRASSRRPSRRDRLPVLPGALRGGDRG